MVESRYLQYDKKAKKVMKSFTPRAAVSGWVEGTCAATVRSWRTPLGPLPDVSVTSGLRHSDESGECSVSIRQSPWSYGLCTSSLPLLLWGLYFVKPVFQDLPLDKPGSS